MAQYKTGTVDVTNGSASVVGHGTAWLANAAVGNAFKLQGSSAVYTIVAIGTDTGLTVSPVYAGATAAGQGYVIAKDYTPNLGLYEPDLQDSDWPILLREAMRKLDERVVNIAIGDTPPDNLPIGGIWLDTSGAIYSAPSIGNIGDQAVLINTPLENIAVTINDAQDVNACQLSVVSSNSAVIPSSAVSFGGTGNNRTMTISGRPSAGAALLTVTVLNTYTGLSASVSFTMVVALTQFVITASAGANGSISPTGAVNVLQGVSRTFTAVPDNGFAASGMTIDGVFMAGISSYTFNDVQTDHTVTASFIISAPANLAATPAAGQNTLTWDAVTGATSYNLYFTSDGSTPSKTHGTQLVGVTSPHVHSSLTNGLTYKYVITAVGAGGESAESSVASGIPVDTWTDAFPPSALHARWGSSLANATLTVNNFVTIDGTGEAAGDAGYITLTAAIPKAAAQYKIKYQQLGSTAASYFAMGLYGAALPGVGAAAGYTKRAIEMSSINGNAQLIYRAAAGFQNLQSNNTWSSAAGANFTNTVGTQYTVIFDFTETTFRITLKNADETVTIAQTPITNWSAIADDATNSYHLFIGDPFTDYYSPNFKIISVAKTL